jgi:hypothetical protein
MKSFVIRWVLTAAIFFFFFESSSSGRGGGGKGDFKNDASSSQ